MQLLSHFLQAPDPNERPLEQLVPGGGYCGIFRSIACIGDSLSAGEYEGTDENGQKTYHDLYPDAWVNQIGRMTGATVYNFSRGGMCAKEYMETYADQNNFWSEDTRAQAYLLALGVNDLYVLHHPLGEIGDLDREDAQTFAGYYGRILQKLMHLSPDAHFFLVTMPRTDDPAEQALGDAHQALLHQMAERFPNTHVIDLRAYAPVYDKAFRDRFYLGGHLSPAGYLLTAQMIASYIDYIIRHSMGEFKQIGFFGTPYRNTADPTAR